MLSNACALAVIFRPIRNDLLFSFGQQEASSLYVPEEAVWAFNVSRSRSRLQTDAPHHTCKWCCPAIKEQSEGESVFFRSCVLSERRRWSSTAFCLDYFRIRTQTVRTRTPRESRGIQQEPRRMHLCRSVHFTALTVQIWGDGAHFCEEHGAFLCSGVSFLERLQRDFPVCGDLHAQDFITRLFGRSRSRSSAVHAACTASCLWSAILRSAAQDAKRNIRR